MTLQPRTDGQEVKYLLPTDILTDEKFNVRPGSGIDDQEIERLAENIERDGQIDAGVVFPKMKRSKGDDDDREEYVLFIGHRRKRAITLINTKRDALSEPLLKMRVVVDRSAKTYEEQLKRAIGSNLHRKNFTAMDLALLIQRIKTENKWSALGFKGTKLTAEWLGVNVATVTQHERFLAAPDEIKAKLADGTYSAQSALDLLAVKPEKRAEVIAKAEEIQAKQPKKKVEAAERVENPVVKKAIRAVEDATDAPIPRTRKEIIEFFTELDGPAYGYPDSAVRQFVQYLTDKWSVGKGTDRTLLTKFDAVAEKSSKGTKASEPAAPVEKKTKAVGAKSERKDKGEKKAKKVKKVVAKKTEEPATSEAA